MTNLAKKVDDRVRCTISDDAKTLALRCDAIKGAVVHVAINKLPESIQDYAKAYGMEVRLTRAGALGKGSTPQERWKEVKDLADYYNGGATSWDRTRTRGPDAFTQLVASDMSDEEILAIIKAKRAAQKG